MKKLAAMILICSMGACILAGCGEKAEPTTEQSTEAISEAISEEATEEASDVASEAESEAVPEKEPEIVNTILTFEEAQAYIEDLKTKYPDMTEEEIVALFVNFNIHSLDSETINYYGSNYNCIIHDITDEKIRAVMDTHFGKVNYSDYWSLTDFVTNEQLKPMAEQLESVLYNGAHSDIEGEFGKCCETLINYYSGENDIFLFDYDSEQRENTDLDSICWFVARYNLIYNKQGLGFDPETGYCPYQEYQNELGLSK